VGLAIFFLPAQKAIEKKIKSAMRKLPCFLCSNYPGNYAIGGDFRYLADITADLVVIPLKTSQFFALNWLRNTMHAVHQGSSKRAHTVRVNNTPVAY
jgi:hypothetical protein